MGGEYNAVNRKVAQAMLERLGVKTVLVKSGSDVLEELDQNTYELILMDCQMPGMDRFGITEVIRQRDGW